MIRDLIIELLSYLLLADLILLFLFVAGYYLRQLYKHTKARQKSTQKLKGAIHAYDPHRYTHRTKRQPSTKFRVGK